MIINVTSEVGKKKKEQNKHYYLKIIGKFFVSITICKIVAKFTAFHNRLITAVAVAAAQHINKHQICHPKVMTMFN